MELKILDKEEIYKSIKDKIVKLIKFKPNCVLGLATGSSPIGVYELLVKEYKKDNISFQHVRTFNLDEYYPIDIHNEKSYHYFMDQHLFSKVDIVKTNTHFPSVETNYEELIERVGGIDLQILGIGRNGHIGFNEPNTPFDSLTHIVDLHESTIMDNARFFDSIEKVPKQAVTMGISSITKAKEIVIIITGKNKAHALKQLMLGKVSEDFPASILNKHPNTTIYADKEALEQC